MNKINSSFWQEQVRQLPVLLQKCDTKREFITAALRNIVEGLSLKRATHLTCLLEETRVDCEVSAETFPADRDFATRKSSELRLLLANIILERASQRCLEKVLTVEGENLNVKAFQIRLPESATQHILILTAPEKGTEVSQLSEDDKQAGFDYLIRLAEVAASIKAKS